MTRAAVVLEHDEVADQVEEALLVAKALDHDLQLGQMRVGQRLARDGAPGLEPLPPGAERADAGLHAVGGDEQRVGGEERRHLGLIGLQLLERAPDRRVLARRVLQLDHRERQAVDEQHHVGPARVLVLGHAELVDGQPVVRLGLVEVDHAGLRAADPAVAVAVFHGHAVHEQPVRGAVLQDQLGALGAEELAEGIVEGFGRQLRIEPRQRVAQPPFEDDLAVVLPLGVGLARRDLGAVDDLPAHAFQPGERRLFDDGFRDAAVAHGCASSSAGAAASASLPSNSAR